MPNPRLPAEFETLETLIGEWTFSSQNVRREKRATSTMEQLRAYYDRVGPLVPAIAVHLDGFAVDQPLPEPQLRLFQLAQMYMEVAWSVEFIGAPEEAGQVRRERWQIIEAQS